MTDPLTPDPVPPNPARRAELLALTSRRLALPRVRRWPGRAAAGGLAVVAFALGWAVKPDPPPRVERVEVPVEVRVEVKVPVEVPAPSPGPVAAAPPAPEKLELAAELADDPAEAARLYRLAGDAFLAPRGDYAEAARCYRLSLRTAPAPDRRVLAADSWLLARMKVSLTQEVSP